MATKTVNRKASAIDLSVIDQDFIEQSFTRVTGAPLITGNDVRLLIDADENYPAWMSAIENAEKRIYFESYIIHDDNQGHRFANALIKKAKDGVDVKLIYDWMGGVGKTSWMFWRKLRRGGVDVRCYNPPKFSDPLGVFSRDHRKSLIVDGTVAFVSGLCVGRDWVGNPSKNIAPWRDTGVELRGPAVADVEAAFGEVWSTMGSPLGNGAIAKRIEIDDAGHLALRVVQSVPGRAHIYRVDQIMAAGVRESMWLTDAYFVGVPSFLQAIKDASMDGVDVRILVPQSTDIAVIAETTRSTYRPLLEAGVRVFEWNGPMMHAKTAVFDGRFSRIGSTNLNVASWFGNYELDVLIEDESFGRQMQEMFLEDMANSTEIVLADTLQRQRKQRPKVKQRRKGGGSMRKATAGALNAATSISSAIAKKAPLGAAEARLLFLAGGAMLILALLLIKYPRGASIPFVIILLLLALPTLFRAIQSYRNS